MKAIYALAVAAGLVVTGCSTYHERDSARFSTPSWGAGSNIELDTLDTPATRDMSSPSVGETETMTPSAGQDRGNRSQMPPSYTDESGNTDPPVTSPDFGPQRR